MSVKIRLRRTGALSAACWRVVVADARSPRDGRFIENLGLYDPRHSCEKINLERAEYWLSVGAIASDTVKAIIKRAKEGKPFPAAPAPVKQTAPGVRVLKNQEAAGDAEAPAAEEQPAGEA